MIELNILSDGTQYDYDQTVQLDGANYRLRMLYSTRREVWTLSLYLEDGTVLIEGQTAVLNVNLLNRCFVDGRPPGNLFASTYSSNTDTPDLTALGNDARCRLFYVPESELEDVG